jgi:hypothetical protein
MIKLAVKNWIIAVFLVFAFVFSFFAAGKAYAHQPVIAGTNSSILIKDPEASKVYYGELTGMPVVYAINSAKPFDLYVNLLASNDSNAKADFSLEVLKGGVSIQRLYGPDHFWMDFYEPFGNDYYLKGPEFESQAESGSYTIKVYSQSNTGKYALAVGKTEIFGLLETVAALRAMPAVKKDFFGKSPWTAYNNYTGLAVFVFLVLLSLAVYVAVAFFKRRQKKNELDRQYKKADEDTRRNNII